MQQILVLSGLPNTRPVLVDFAYLLTKNLSLLVCGHVLRGTSSQRYRNYLQERATSWFRKHRVKGFYSLVDGEDFEAGTRALMQVSEWKYMRILFNCYKPTIPRHLASAN